MTHLFFQFLLRWQSCFLIAKVRRFLHSSLCHPMKLAPSTILCLGLSKQKKNYWHSFGCRECKRIWFNAGGSSWSWSSTQSQTLFCTSRKGNSSFKRWWVDISLLIYSYQSEELMFLTQNSKCVLSYFKTWGNGLLLRLTYLSCKTLFREVCCWRQRRKLKSSFMDHRSKSQKKTPA